MKKAIQLQPMWDYYYDKQLETLLQEYEFDFEKVAETFNKITESRNYTKQSCEERYTQLYLEQKQQKSDLMEEMLMAAEGKRRNKSIYELFHELPLERTPKDYLKVTPEDFENAFSVSAITGEIIRPTGRV